jgi:hypothetical protein
VATVGGVGLLRRTCAAIVFFALGESPDGGASCVALPVEGATWSYLRYIKLSFDKGHLVIYITLDLQMEACKSKNI